MKKFGGNQKEKKQLYIAVIFTVALVLGVGYAFLNSTLNITGNTKIKENSWDVHFENFTPKSGSVQATSAGIDTAGTSVNYTVTLSKPGDFYEFTVDAVNKGSIDAMINTISNTGLTSAQSRYMSYNVAYSDGTAITEKQKLVAETGKETIKVRVEYKKDITASDLPTTDQTVSLTFSVTYVQADGSAIAVKHPVCRRGSSLHSDGTHTFGRLGSGNTLVSGDVFDCDVNGDGSFIEINERFYYIPSSDSNSSYASLIYYNNVSAGSPSSTATFAYDSQSNARENGPVTAVQQLPTTSSWKGVSLANTTRNITDQTGAEYLEFSYAGRAARLLTFQEAVSACSIGNPKSQGEDGYMDFCNYLTENTQYSDSSYVYGFWLEGSPAAGAAFAWYDQGIFSDGAANPTQCGVRPVIEVPLSAIQK